MNMGLTSQGPEHGESAEKDRVGAGRRWETPAGHGLLTYLGQKVQWYDTGMQIHRYTPLIPKLAGPPFERDEHREFAVSG